MRYVYFIVNNDNTDKIKSIYIEDFKDLDEAKKHMINLCQLYNLDDNNSHLKNKYFIGDAIIKNSIRPCVYQCYYNNRLFNKITKKVYMTPMEILAIYKFEFMGINIALKDVAETLKFPKQ